MVEADKKCGIARTGVDPTPVPTDGKAAWRGNDGGGPCELYIDDAMVLYSDDCESDYPGDPSDSGVMSETPLGYSSCSGDCVFAIYWLGFPNAQWHTSLP
ncbi:Oxygen-dependent choline dehydrogenase [Phytophthora cinnamomi]|uniref:Oxygen-dependent choline dehydrogenase n=1 Tax=Phytophthora cinnamomi TaxID=4785 RepID=UPI00355ABF6D|nr:Oxygen-dependent choline dehydrogenase [Phytophthora cinnamomi]